MKLVLVFLACALLFELSTSVPPMNPFRCKTKNGTLICERNFPKPIFKNHTECSIGYTFFCYKKTSGENKCSCIHNSKIFNGSFRKTQCPEGTSLQCRLIRRGCVGINECSCIDDRELTPLSNLTKIKKKEKNLLD